jgi:hypothetical protein
MELETVPNDDQAIVQSEPVAFGDLSPMMQWAAEARQVALIAKSLAQTSFVPKAFQNKPAEVTAAIMAGQEIGLQPVAALRSIDVIQGKPSLSAVAMRGLVQSKGHEVWVEESTETRAIVKGRRRGEEAVQESKWTIDRAKRMGLTSKSTWKEQPQAMLIARATGEICRLVAADVILGMPYAKEELLDMGEDVEVKAVAKAVKKRTVKRQEIAEPELEPPAALPSAESSEDNTDSVEAEPEFSDE